MKNTIELVVDSQKSIDEQRKRIDKFLKRFPVIFMGKESEYLKRNPFYENPEIKKYISGQVEKRWKQRIKEYEKTQKKT